MSKSILITGASGFLGGRIAVAKALQNKPLILNGRNFENKIPNNFHAMVIGDLTHDDTLSKIDEYSIDTIIHCASKSSPWGSYDDFYKANVLAQKALLKLALSKEVKKYIYISSPSIYFEFSDQINIPNDAPIPARFVNHYAKTKYMAEKELENSGINFIILRPRALIGAHDRVIMPRLIRAAKDQKLRRFGDGSALVDLTAVSNLVDLITDLTLSERPLPNRAYNISNGQPVLLWEYIDQMLKLLNLPPVEKSLNRTVALYMAKAMEVYQKLVNPKREPVLTQYGVGTLSYSFTFDISAAHKDLGYKSKQSIDDAMVEFVDWYKTTIV